MAMERIFAHFKDDTARATASYDPNDPDSYDNYVRSMMSDSVDYEQSILAGDRGEAQLYYYGYEPSIGLQALDGPYRGEDPTATIGEILNKYDKNKPNRSTYVSTDVRDAVMMMLPSLVRLFGASESPVFFVPRSEEEVDTAEQSTDYVNYVFWNDNPGFLNLYGAIKDALTVRAGFLKWWSEDFRERRRKRFTNISADQIQGLLMEDPSAKLIEVGKPIKQPPPKAPPQAPMGPPPPSPGPPPGPMAAPGPMSGLPSGMPPGPMAGAAPPTGLMAPSGPPPPPPPIFDHVVIEYEVEKPLIKVEGVPPEEMRLDRYARTFASLAYRRPRAHRPGRSADRHGLRPRPLP